MKKFKKIQCVICVLAILVQSFFFAGILTSAEETEEIKSIDLRIYQDHPGIVGYDVEYLFTVHENVFSPPPKVKSAVVLMKRNGRTCLECDEELFKKIVKGTFNQRRKKLRNSIQQIVGKDSPLLSDPILEKRPEQLSIDEFIELTKKVEQEQK